RCVVAWTSAEYIVPLTLARAPGTTNRWPQWIHLPCLPASSSGTCSVALEPGQSICMGRKHQGWQANASERRREGRKRQTRGRAAASTSVYTPPKIGGTGKPRRRVIGRSRSPRAGGRNSPSCERFFQC